MKHDKNIFSRFFRWIELKTLIRIAYPFFIKRFRKISEAKNKKVKKITGLNF